MTTDIGQNSLFFPHIRKEYRKHLHNNYLMKDSYSITRILLRISAFKRAIAHQNPSNINKNKAEGLLPSREELSTARGGDKSSQQNTGSKEDVNSSLGNGQKDIFK